MYCKMFAVLHACCAFILLATVASTAPGISQAEVKHSADFNARERVIEKFSFTGKDEYFAVPFGVSWVHVKVWGAGGGGGNPSERPGKGTNTAAQKFNFDSAGGGGGFASGYLRVKSREILRVIVGHRGTFERGQPGADLPLYGGGGRALGGFAGSGGGRSALASGSWWLADLGGR